MSVPSKFEYEEFIEGLEEALDSRDRELLAELGPILDRMIQDLSDTVGKLSAMRGRIDEVLKSGD